MSPTSWQILLSSNPVFSDHQLKVVAIHVASSTNRHKFHVYRIYKGFPAVGIIDVESRLLLVQITVYCSINHCHIGASCSLKYIAIYCSRKLLLYSNRSYIVHPGLLSSKIAIYYSRRSLLYWCLLLPRVAGLFICHISCCATTLSNLCGLGFYGDQLVNRSGYNLFPTPFRL